MAWNDKYWDIISNIYWTPRYIGLKSISRDKWRLEGDEIAIPRALIVNSSGPLYYRARKSNENRVDLNGKEEILNHVFNLAFAIAGDEVVSRLLCRPLEIADSGPFQSIGREIGSRYGWRESENVTQQDSFFVTPASLIAVELKLGSISWPEQIAKYMALMIWEEEVSGTRPNLGLLFIVQAAALPSHWACVGLTGPHIDAKFAGRLDRTKLPKKIQNLFEQKPDKFASVLRRLRLAVVSWNSFRDQIEAIEHGLDCSRAGDQTLQRLLSGLRAQIDDHDNTGIEARPDTPSR